MASFDITNYKMKLIKDIIGNGDIVAAIDSRADGFLADLPDTLVYRNVFPYLRLADIEETADTYILLEVEEMSEPNGCKHARGVRIILRVLAHRDRMKMDDRIGTRVDYIAGKLTALFQGQTKYGLGELALEHDKAAALNAKHHYREIVFKTTDLVTPLCDD